MDIARPDQSKARRKKRILYGSITALVLAGITLGLARLKPAAPTVDRNLVWIDTVKQGQMLRQVRGLGTLVPEEIRWIAARTQGRVDKIILRPGAVVEPGSLILVLANPDVESNARRKLVFSVGSRAGASCSDLGKLRFSFAASFFSAQNVVPVSPSEWLNSLNFALLDAGSSASTMSSDSHS